MQKTPVAKVVLFCLVTATLSAVPYQGIIASGAVGPNATLLMMCPGLAALLVQWTFERNLRGLGWRPRRFRFLALGYALPLAYALAAYGLVWATGLGRLAPDEMTRVLERAEVTPAYPLLSTVLYILMLLTAGVAINMPVALGEELGWRGLLTPELARLMPPGRAALVSGLTWAVWHLPAIWFADYGGPGVPRWYSALCFTGLAVGASYLCTWLRLRSGSVWPAVLWHASHNVLIQAVLTPLTADTGPTWYLVDEFGILSVAAVWLVVAIVWPREHELFWPRHDGA